MTIKKKLIFKQAKYRKWNAPNIRNTDNQSIMRIDKIKSDCGRELCFDLIKGGGLCCV